MSNQYSFWPGVTGLDAWDVDRLMEFASGLPIEEVELEEIHQVDTKYWFGDGSPDPTVRVIIQHVQLIEEADLSYPIILGPKGRVMDGMHRVAKALLEHRRTIAAVRLEKLPPPDYSNCTPSELPY